MGWNNHMSVEHEDLRTFLDLLRSECEAGKTAWGEYYILAAFISVQMEADRSTKAAAILARYHRELDGSLGIAPEEL